MRIAIATDWFPPRRGGIESQLWQLATGLSARGHDVDVLTATPGPEAGNGFGIRRLPGSLPFIDAALSPAMLAALWRELQTGYDVVHAHVSVVSPVAYAAALRACAQGRPSVVTFHSILRLKRHLLRAGNNVFDFAANGTVWTAVSELVATQLRSALATDVGILPNGFDRSFWQANGERHRGSVITFVSVMRLHSKKRPRALVRAFLDASRCTSQPVQLRLIGDGPERAAIESEVVQGAPHPNARVDVVGWSSPAVVRSELARADAFVLPSRREAFGIAALEAAAMGVPVITMADSGSREFVRDEVDGLLCRDDAALAGAIRRYVSDPALRANLSNAQRDLGRYEWPRVLDAHEETYHRATARVSARASTGS
jgi:glycosyltransferase involved in cell wall biosynthesis